MNRPQPNFDDRADRPCGDCHGTGIRKGWASGDYIRPDEPCRHCAGKGVMSAPDWNTIMHAIQGRKPGTLRASRPDRKYGERVYFLWRLARFHGGADVTMPIMAEVCLGRDPFEPELNAAAEYVAKRVFGTDMAAAYRWRGALGHSGSAPDGLPPTAYASGPVLHDATKPDEELAELW